MKELFIALCLSVTAASAAEPVTIDALAFNIRFDNPGDGKNAWPERAEMVGEWLKSELPDVVGIQEGLRHQLDAILKAVPEYAEFGVGRDDGKEAGEYTAILYHRERFEPGVGGTFWLSDTPEVVASKSWGNEIPRICTWLYLTDKKSGAGFTLYNVHLDHQSQPSRERSVALLKERIQNRENASDPFILMGDFNAGETNPAVRALLSGDPEMVDSYRVVHPEETRVKTFHGFQGGESEGAKIDHVFISKGSYEVEDAEIVRYARDGHYLSDHYPVRARIMQK